MKNLCLSIFLIILSVPSVILPKEKKNILWTAECVSSGHPDKMADQISDAILDAYLTLDPYSKVACETLIKGETIVVAGEVTSQAKIPIESVIYDTITNIGYDDPCKGLDLDQCKVIQLLSKQSPEIENAV